MVYIFIYMIQKKYDKHTHTHTHHTCIIHAYKGTSEKNDGKSDMLSFFARAGTFSSRLCVCELYA